MRYLRSSLAGLLFGLSAICGLAIAQTFTGAMQLSQDLRSFFVVDTNGNFYIQGNRHLLNSNNSAAAPVISSCAGGTLVAGSTDISGAVSGTTGTTCTLTFAQAFLTAPHCVTSGSVSSAATTGPVSNSTTTTTLVMTVAATGAGTWSYFCMSPS